MIIFDRLQISDDGKMLYIDIHVNKASYFDSIYINKVVIQTSDQVSESDPLTPGEEYVYSMTADDETRELHLALSATTDFESVYSTLSDKLLFVYVICTGTPDECTPCRLDEMTTLGVTFDTALLHQKVMQFTRELNRQCQLPKEFIDMILLWNGFKSAIETEHYIVAIDFWNRLFNSHYATSIKTTNSCGCHG